MLKRPFAIAVGGSAALLLAGCGGSSDSGNSGTTPAAGTPTAATSSSGAGAPAAAPTTVSTKDPARDAKADLVIWSDADRAPVLSKYAAQFGQENGITVAVQIVTDARQQFKDATKVGKGPDVLVGAHDWLGELVQNGTVAPVNLAAADQAKFAPQAIAAAKYNGQLYGAPYAVENIGLIRNTALAPTAPKTLDDLLTTGKSLVASKKATNILAQQIGKKGDAYNAYPYLSAYGGGIFGTKANGDYDPAKVIVNSAATVKGGDALAKMGQAKALSTNIDDKNVDTLFGAKKTPYMISGPWAIDKIKKAGIKYAIDPLPSVVGGGAMKPFLGVQMFYVSAKAKNAAFAQEFVTKYVPREDVQVALFTAGNRPPALTAAYNKVAATNPDVKAWFEAGKEGKPMPNIPAMNSVWEPLGLATADVISGKAQPQARFDAAQKEIVANIAKG
ncbi:sugar ABC transporter substrate-binding protein [Luteipulveratus mongoliensis]|uniref:ABC transporter substrate-binding protein n=1 Tax=Luteipulveratus mongoliensis TaxID=571913 RepID=A0A0K1JGL7_9MICO|nr:maltose ABC transporter substrate-binding protein [Luteipulveratus mongoliensis]AKU15718.1 ABC transporter substrate-binding protein [Luteipulveratus mongoliensis]